MRALIAGAVACATLAGCKNEFEDYAHKAKLIEAKVSLGMLAKRLKLYATEHGGVPVGKAPLTPDTPCCAGPNHKCPMDMNRWTGEPWATLEFEVYEDQRFQYDYESDGKTVTAHAVGDLDCNGHTTTVTLEGTVAGDSVTVTVDGKLQ
jgi:hypothetical protein